MTAVECEEKSKSARCFGEESMTLPDRYRRWFEYEKDSHAKVLVSLNSVPAQNRGAAPFKKAVDLLAHIVAGRLLWLFRLGGASAPPSDLFPQGFPFENLASRIQEMEALWDVFLARLDDSQVARTIEYRTTEGSFFRNNIEDILTQLYGHSLYHRGQIASLVRASGGEPAKTDFIFWVRQAVPAAK
jgi:uncharacterized damage-inducible protein DinB